MLLPDDEVVRAVECHRGRERGLAAALPDDEPVRIEDHPARRDARPHDVLEERPLTAVDPDDEVVRAVEDDCGVALVPRRRGSNGERDGILGADRRIEGDRVCRAREEVCGDAQRHPPAGKRRCRPEELGPGRVLYDEAAELEAAAATQRPAEAGNR